MAERDVVGEAWWQFKGDDAQLRGEVAKTEQVVKESATRGGSVFSTAMGSATSKVKGFFSDLGNVAKGFFAVLAAQQVVSFLGDAVTAAREETAGVAALTASLKANSAAFDGNTDSIEKTIEQRMALGFADDEQRESLAGLTAITKDHNKALELQRTAMDFARLRNIDLRTATDILGKVYGGNIGILSRYGIQLEKGATSTEALAKIQEMAAGQAEAWAETSEGAAQTTGLAMGELTEDIGNLLLPMITELAKFTRDVLVPALRGLVEAASWIGEHFVGPIVAGIGNVIQSFREAAGDVDFFAMNFGEQGNRVHGIADRFGLDFDELKDRIRDNMVETGATFEEAADKVESELERAKVEGSASAWALQQEIAAAAAAGNLAARTEADGVATAVPDAIVQHWEEIRQSGEDTYVAWKTGFYDGQASIQSDIEAFLKSLETHMAPEDEIMYLQGQRAVLEHERAIRDNDPFAQAAIDDMVADINRRLRGLNGYVYGQNLVVTLASGIRQNLGTASLASAALSRVVAGPVRVESEPKDPASGLRGITRWGGNIVRTIAGDVLATLDVARQASSAFSAALVPALPAGALATAMVPAVAASGAAAPTPVTDVGTTVGSGRNGATVIERHVHLHTEGPTPVNTEDDLARLLDRTQWVAGEGAWGNG